MSSAARTRRGEPLVAQERQAGGEVHGHDDEGDDGEQPPARAGEDEGAEQHGEDEGPRQGEPEQPHLAHGLAQPRVLAGLGGVSEQHDREDELEGPLEDAGVRVEGDDRVISAAEQDAGRGEGDRGGDAPPRQPARDEDPQEQQGRQAEECDHSAMS
ncbi:hypothetical protein [Streptomyces sp. NPDC003863]